MADSQDLGPEDAPAASLPRDRRKSWRDADGVRWKVERQYNPSIKDTVRGMLAQASNVRDVMVLSSELLKVEMSGQVRRKVNRMIELRLLQLRAESVRP